MSSDKEEEEREKEGGGLFEKQASSLHSDGRRNHVHPADVKGKFTTGRNLIFIVLLAVYVLLPWVHIGEHPALFFDIAARRFYVFGLTFNAQDTWLLFFLLSGLGFGLFVLTAIFGRVWCGYACPQTVFLESVYRRIERWIEGPRVKRMRRNAAAWNWDKLWRKVLKHLLFITFSAALAHVFISYFVSLPKLFEMMRHSPSEHMTAFLWVISLTGLMYFNFAFFREQMCLIVCPYGRLQSVMTDKDTIIIGYDTRRGEPRAKKSSTDGGDCVDCGRCTAVCPTGIDIRNGLQLDCIGCAACVDACDEIMVKLKRSPGLIRYDSLRGLAGQTRRFWRPRLALYGGLAVLGLVVATLGVRSHTSFEANLLRLGGTPYLVEDDGRIQNLYEIHLINKQDETRIFEINPADGSTLEYVIAMSSVELKGGQGMRVPVFVYSDPNDTTENIALVVDVKNSELRKELEAAFLRPRR
jgi:cytochrome c oxidase accessory protein FixG